MSVIQLHSNIKKITSDSTPNSLDLPDGNLAFGIIDGKPRMYANVDNQIFQFPVPILVVTRHHGNISILMHQKVGQVTLVQ